VDAIVTKAITEGNAPKTKEELQDQVDKLENT
jgi:hypothetical protein